MAKSDIEQIDSLGSVFQRILEENEEYKRLQNFVRVYQDINKCSKTPLSSKAYRVFDLPLETIANSICGYLEELEQLKKEKSNG